VELADIAARTARLAALRLTPHASTVCRHKRLCNAEVAVFTVTGITALRRAIPAATIFLCSRLDGGDDVGTLVAIRLAVRRRCFAFAAW